MGSISPCLLLDSLLCGIMPATRSSNDTIGLGWSPGVRVVLVDGRDIAQNRLNHAPGRFYCVFAHKKRRVAMHGITQ